MLLIYKTFDGDEIEDLRRY